MKYKLNRLSSLLLVWFVLAAAGSVLLVRFELTQLRNAFDTDARIIHRLLSQRVVQHDALLSSLALLQPLAGAERRLSSVYPQILDAKRREAAAVWPDAAFTQAESRSRSLRRAEFVAVDFAAGRYALLSAAEPASFALWLDLASVVPWAEWPMDAKTSPVRVSLEHLGQRYTVQPGGTTPGGIQQPQLGWRFEAQKTLASESQPFNAVAVQHVAWTQLRWLRIVAWWVTAAALVWAVQLALRQQEQRRRAEAMLRLSQVARLNQMGELAAGFAHELNQPLTAVLANTQAALRLLRDAPPDIDVARGAMEQAAGQARRAAEVITRLRRSIDPAASAPVKAVNLAQAAQAVLHLLKAELQSNSVEARVEANPPTAQSLLVLADPVALEQIIHNLVTNATEAMANTPRDGRVLTLRVQHSDINGVLSVSDTGSGIAAAALPRVFEPFFSTREGGLGLGLSICESLAQKMGGQLTASNNTGPTGSRGASFRLSLPIAQDIAT